jgi:hypothetical protein
MTGSPGDDDLHTTERRSVEDCTFVERASRGQGEGKQRASRDMQEESWR